MLDDGEAEACSPKLAAAGAIHAIEPLKDSWQESLVDAAAFVGDGDRDLLARWRCGFLRGDANPHRAAHVAVFDGIVDEVDQRLLQQRRVDCDNDLRLTLDSHAD